MSRALFATVLMLTLALSAGDAWAQGVRITRNPVYDRARLRTLLEQWEARLPVVKRQVEVSKAQLAELGPLVAPAKAEAETARRQTLRLREGLKAVTDQVVGEIGAAQGLDVAERKRDSAAARRDAQRAEALAAAGDDPDRKARAEAVAEAGAKLDAVKADANASGDQRLLAVSALTAAQARLAEHDRAVLSASDAYAAAELEASSAAAEATAIRARVLRDAKADERIKIAEQALRDAQRVTTAASNRAGSLEAQFRTHRGRYTASATELAQLEANITGARRELGIGVLPLD